MQTMPVPVRASAGINFLALVIAVVLASFGCSDQSKPDRAKAEAQAKLTALRFERDKVKGSVLDFMIFFFPWPF